MNQKERMLQMEARNLSATCYNIGEYMNEPDFALELAFAAQERLEALIKQLIVESRLIKG